MTTKPSIGSFERDPLFYIETVTFLVENTLFKLPRPYFEHKSGVFKDMFTVSSGADLQGEKEEMSDHNSIRLESIKKINFQRLLSVMLSDLFAICECTPMGREEWISVLMLSSLWAMEELRQKALDGLSETVTDLMDKVILAREYNIEKRLVEVYIELVLRNECPSFEETETLGWKTAYRIFAQREKHHGLLPRALTMDIIGPFKETMLQTFEEELKDIRYGDHAVTAAELDVPVNKTIGAVVRSMLGVSNRMIPTLIAC